MSCLTVADTSEEMILELLIQQNAQGVKRESVKQVNEEPPIFGVRLESERQTNVLPNSLRLSENALMLSKTATNSSGTRP